MEFIYLSRVLCPLSIKGQPTHDRSHVVLMAQLGEHCTGNAKVVGSNPAQSLKMFPGHFPSSVMAAFASIVISSFNCYCWTSITNLISIPLQRKKYFMVLYKNVPWLKIHMKYKLSTVLATVFNFSSVESLCF